jgi:hypothetical protein
MAQPHEARPIDDAAELPGENGFDGLAEAVTDAAAAPPANSSAAI